MRTKRLETGGNSFLLSKIYFDSIREGLYETHRSKKKSNQQKLLIRFWKDFYAQFTIGKKDQYLATLATDKSLEKSND